MKRICFAGLMLLLFTASYAWTQDDRSEEISKLMAGLESASWAQRVNSAKIISRAGLQDQALYQKVAALLEAGYAEEFEKNHTDEMSWMCKALAASGDPQYKGLLSEVANNAPSSKLQRYARQSLDLFEQYVKRNQILNAKANWDDQLSAEENRLVSMLRSDDIGLKRDAAKSIVRSFGMNAKVFDAAATAVTEMAKAGTSGNLNSDTIAWLCKALGASGHSKYVDVLNQVLASIPEENIKLRSYAIEARNSLE